MKANVFGIGREAVVTTAFIKMRWQDWASAEKFYVVFYGCNAGNAEFVHEEIRDIR